jgi:hypothetical protein
MRLVTASAKNHSRIRPSDSASAITSARAERGAIRAGVQLHSMSGSVWPGFRFGPFLAN